MAASDVLTLTRGYRVQQVRRSALVATLVAAYYADRVDPENPEAVEKWLDLILPKILSTSRTNARLAAAYANRLRQIEVPSAPAFVMEAIEGSIEEQIRKSLLVVGPGDYRNKLTVIEGLDVSPQQAKALQAQAKRATVESVMASTLRHAQSGARQTLIRGAEADAVALGYVRVTKATPCFFCAMLASRGLVFAEDSFDLSDPRFTGEGTVKVHDSCGCTMKPVYTRNDDPFLDAAAVYTDLWSEWGAGGGDAALRFRRGYEHYVATGEKLPYAVVADAEAFRARFAA